MTRQIRIATTSVVVALSFVAGPLTGRLYSQTPPAPPAPAQMGQMPGMGQGRGGMDMGAMRGMDMGQMRGMDMGAMCPMMAGMKDGHGAAMSENDAALEKVLAALGVTADQKARMAAVKDQHQADVRALTARADAARLALRQAVEALTFDEAAVRAKSSALAAIMSDGALMELRIRNEAFKMLTADQQKRAAAIQKLQREIQELMKGSGH